MDENFAASLAAYRAYSRQPYSERRLSDFITIIDAMFPVVGYSAKDQVLDQALIANPRLFRDDPHLFSLYDRPPIELKILQSMVSSTLTTPNVNDQQPTKPSKKRSRSDRTVAQDLQEGLKVPKSEPKIFEER